MQDRAARLGAVFPQSQTVPPVVGALLLAGLWGMTDDRAELEEGPR